MSAIHDLWDYVKSLTAIVDDTHNDSPAVVDCHFISVVVYESLDRDKFRSLVEAAEHGEFCDMPLDRLRQGPSYIELGAWIGDQTAALRLMAVGKVAGCWDVITPKTLGLDGDEAEQLAGQGFVMVSGYNAAVPS